MVPNVQIVRKAFCGSRIAFQAQIIRIPSSYNLQALFTRCSAASSHTHIHCAGYQMHAYCFVHSANDTA
jgi:hypothetical protein